MGAGMSIISSIVKIFRPKKPKSTAQINSETVLGILHGYNVTQKVCVLVALENINIYFSVYLNENRKIKRSNLDLDDFISDAAKQIIACQSSSIEDEVARRRLAYFQVAAMVKILLKKAKLNNVDTEWSALAEIWLLLLQSSGETRTVLNKLHLWRPDETDWFAEVITELDGEKHCEMMTPKEIRYHEKITEWEYRDLDPDIKAEIDRISE